MEGILPIRIQQHLQLSSVGISNGFKAVTMESDKYICVRETVDDSEQVVIINIANPQTLIRSQIRYRACNRVIVNPSAKLLALKAKRTLRIFDIETKSKVKTHVFIEDIVYWKWINVKTIALVTNNAVFHWSIEPNSLPIKIFDLCGCLSCSEIINYRTYQCLYHVLIRNSVSGMGFIKLYSVESKVSQQFSGYAGAFTQFKLEGNPELSTLFCFADRTQVGGKLHIMEIGSVPTGNQPYPKKVVDIFFPPEVQTDFPVGLEMSPKYGVVYLMTKHGYIHLYDIETGICIFNNRIKSENIFYSTYYELTSGIIAVNLKGQVLSVSVDEETLIPYITNTLRNPELALRMAARNNITGFVVQLESLKICSICLETITSNNEINRVLNNCKHLFHEQCICLWLQNNNTCPLCRVTVDFCDYSNGIL